MTELYRGRRAGIGREVGVRLDDALSTFSGSSTTPLSCIRLLVARCIFLITQVETGEKSAVQLSPTGDLSILVQGRSGAS